MERLKGKVSLITGAGSGIGKKTAEIFAEEGSDLILVARRAEKLEKTASLCTELGVRAITITADVSSEDDCVRAVKSAVESFGRIDILVNNAGISDKHFPITRCDSDLWDRVIRVDQYSIYYMMREALKYMGPANSGSIINISSIGAISFNAGIAYTAAKSAVIGMSKNAAIQFAGTGIRINVVAPGPTPTELNMPEKATEFDREFATHCAKFMDDTLPDTTPEDQAYAILFFASDESKACNGQVLVVDNGMTI